MRVRVRARARVRVRVRVRVQFCLVRFAHLDGMLTVATTEACTLETVRFSGSVQEVTEACTLETVLFSGAVPVIAATDRESQQEFLLG